MNTLKLPMCEDEYDAAVSKRFAVVFIPATPLWERRLGGPEDTRPTEITFYRGITGDGKPRRCITVPVTGIVRQAAPSPGNTLGIFCVKHAALDAANEKTEEIQ